MFNAREPIDGDESRRGWCHRRRGTHSIVTDGLNEFVVKSEGGWTNARAFVCQIVNASNHHGYLGRVNKTQQLYASYHNKNTHATRREHALIAGDEMYSARDAMKQTARSTLQRMKKIETTRRQTGRNHPAGLA